MENPENQALDFSAQVARKDANNNSGESASHRKQQRNEIDSSIQSLKPSSDATTNNSDVSGSENMEDWQILEAEVELDDDSSTLSYKMSAQKQQPKQYIEIDPIDFQKEYSPKLVQTFTALYAFIPLASFIAFHSVWILLFTRFWYLSVVYFIYLVWDKQTCNRGGRRIDFVYRSKFWSYLAAYFPIKLRFAEDFELDPNENYILNYHPHGISAFGAVVAFATNGLKFCSRFPGITSRFMVHETLFLVPIMREVFSARGDCSVNSKSFDYLLTRNKGNLLTLVAGGLAEADISDPEVLKIVIAKRKGFVKKAIVHGANLIPCIAFGENSVYTKVNFAPSSFMHRLETKWYQLFKFKHPIYYGDSAFSSSSKGSMPYRRQITVVMGNPIKVDRVEKPSQEQVDQIHSHYMNEVKALYESNSDLCKEYDRKLEFV